jgi:mono/diheme cytochrome c family protein
MGFSVRRSRLALAGVSLAAFAASASAQTSIKDIGYYGFGEDGPSSIADADAREGLRSILAGEDFTYGLPVKLFDKIARQRHYDAETMWRILGSAPSAAWRDQQGIELQMSDSAYERNGAKLLNVNCFSCHSGVVAGRLIAGAGSSHIDVASFNANTAELIKKFRSPIGRIELALLLNRAEMASLKGFIEHQESVAMPVLQAKARGEIHGPWVVWNHIARMVDPSKGMQTVPVGKMGPLQYLLQRPLPPVDPSPWWNLKYKERDFWTRDVNLDSLPTFALNLMDPAPDNTATFPARMERVKKQLAFARSVEAPAFPWRSELDATLVERGRALFHGEAPLADGSTLPCSRCHGQYDGNGTLLSFPNRDRVPLAVIGTDPAYASILTDDFAPLYEYFRKSMFISPTSTNAQYPATAGYAPPPLKGLWASPPYFHNGSVPTVEAVLNSKIRPTFWRRSLDPFAYDQERLGLLVTSVPGEELRALRDGATASGDPLSDVALELRRVYDTTDFGRTATGHTFGDAMNDDERHAVLEFLKTL